MFEDLKLPIVKRTPKGEPSTDESTLTQLINLHDIPKLLLERRKKMKILTTYLRGIKRNTWEGGRIHSSFHIVGTETGRLSSSNPNLQNLPRLDEMLEKLGVVIRNLLVSPNFDTHYLVEVDYSQAELRLLAEYSRDENLYNAFLKGQDPHAMLGVHLYHKDQVPAMNAEQIDARDIVAKEERQKAKTANFALAYGKHWKNFGKENNLDENESKYIFNTFWDTYKGIAKWKERILVDAYDNLYFTSYFGRRRRMKKLLSSDFFKRAEAEREGINFVIQSQASDYTLDSTLKVCAEARRRDYDFKTVSFVHDSAVYEVNKNNIQGFCSLLKEKMEHVEGVSLTMEIDIKVGYRLGALRQWSLENSEWKEIEKS